MSESKIPHDRHGKALTGRQTYNVVTDTVTGPNVRFKDNLYQGIAVLLCALIGTAVGYYLGSGTAFAGWTAAGLGAVAGLLVGVVASGAFLMVYRGSRHAQGRHD